jgi:aldehyde:ferredoxin oxidoreductase
MALRVLQIHLDTNTVQPEELPSAVEQEYAGGRGAAAWLLTHRLPPGTGPLSPANLLVFSTGTLTGTAIPATSTFVASTRSPLTGAIAHSWAQGAWGAALRRAGYDALTIQGRSENWCFITIDGPKVAVRPAGDLLGLDTVATDRVLRHALGADYRVICVGPAGEAGVAYSSIVADGRFMAEPAGTGVVMAFKRIKAIAIRDSAPVRVADLPRAQAVSAQIAQRAGSSPLAAGITQYGSNYYLPFAKENGALTSYNGQQGRAHIHGITRTTLAQHAPREGFGCEGCPLSCHSRYTRPNGGTAAYPELEAVAGFAAQCGITSLEALATVADRCLRLGLDTASTSAALAFLMECQEQGLSRTGAIGWGDEDAILEAVERLGQKQEKRDMLSLGVGEMQEIFWGSSAWAPHVKGLAMPGLDPRAGQELALALATSPIGGDYRYSMDYAELLPDRPAWVPDGAPSPQNTDGKVARLIWHERFAAALDAAGVCRRLALMAYQVTPADLTELLSASLGRPFGSADLARLGERIVTVERLFMQKHSTVSSADTLPVRWRTEPLGDGLAANHLPALDSMLPEYYKRHGWDAKGTPTDKRLAELNIEA